MNDERAAVTGHLLALLTIFIWGTTFISTKLLLADFTPLEILFFRFILGYAVLALLRPRRLRTRSFREELLFIAAGLCGVTLYFLIENIALVYTQASNVGVIVSIAPFLTALIAHFWLREEERLSAPFITGFVIALSGIVCILLNGSLQLQLNPAGDLLALLAPVVWAVYSVLMRKISALQHNTIAVTRRVFFYGLLGMLPALPLLPFRFGLDRFSDTANVANLLFLGLGASALCFATWNRAVGILGAVRTSVYIYLVPVITVTAAVLLLHEKLTVAILAGTVLTLTGSFLSERQAKTTPGKGVALRKSN